MSRLPSNAGYGENAEHLLKHYDSHSFEAVHGSVLSYFPTRPSTVLDIGCGSGRDAAHFAALGHNVTAVEPTKEFLSFAKTQHAQHDIQWLPDRLPELNLLRELRVTYDLVLLSAVWMHLDRLERKEAMQNLANLVHAGSTVVISLRHGPIPEGRVMYDVSADETIKLAKPFGLAPVFNESTESVQAANRRLGVRWTKLVFIRG